MIVVALFPVRFPTMSVVLATVVIVVFVNVVNGVCGDDGPLVMTSKGAIRGRDEGNYTTFFGIPYALVDEANPFGVSRPHPNFMSPFEAYDPTVKCPQAAFTATGTLQCLRLNIYVPKTTKRNIPVFFWIHGGGFIFGSAGEYDGKHLVEHEIIVVTVNYRLGPYGFFCLNTDETPGNQGLKDQVTALRWVKKNIAAFGGDPDKITIAGESYGGGSVELHIYSEFEKLFDKAIIQSGGADVEAIFVNPDGKAAINLAKIFNADVKRRDSLSTLAKQDPIAVMKAFNSSGVLLRACKEKRLANKGIENFLTANSSNFYSPDKVGGTPILIGYNSKETFADFVRKPDEYYATTPDIFLEKIRNNFKFSQRQLSRVVDSVKKFYLGNKPLSKKTMLELVDFTSDFMVNHPEERAVTRFLNQSAPVYKYMFAYTGNSPYKNVHGVGAYHTEELQYLFEWNKAELSGDDNLMMRRRMTAMWTNFVKHGNPTPHKTELIPVQWQRVTQDARAYLHIDQHMQMKDNAYQQRMNFWDVFYDVYGKNSLLK